VRATPRVMVALKKSRYQAAEVLEQLVKSAGWSPRLLEAGRSGRQVREPSPSEALQQKEDEADFRGHQGGILQPRPDVVPRQVPLTCSTTRMGRVQVSSL